MYGGDRNCKCQKPKKTYCSDPCKYKKNPCCDPCKKPCCKPDPCCDPCKKQNPCLKDPCTTNKWYDPCCCPEYVYYRTDGIFRPCCGNNIYDSMRVCCDTDPCCILQSYPNSTKAMYITKYNLGLCCNVGCNKPRCTGC